MNPKVYRLVFLQAAVALSLGLTACFAADSAEVEQAMKLFTDNDFDHALPIFDKLVDEDPTNGNYHFWRGRCLAGLQKAKEACAEYKVAMMLAADPKLKENCKTELASFNESAPKGSVNEGAQIQKEIAHGASSSDFVDGEGETGKNGERLFKLQSNKLEWNLNLSKDFAQQMKARTDNLEAMAKGTQFRAGTFAGLPLRNARPVNIQAELASGPAHFTGELSNEEKKFISNCDVVIILDHSGSMGEQDCPSMAGTAEPRMAWAAEELDHFAQTLSSSFPHGFSLITFDTRPDTYNVNSAMQLHSVLAGLRFGGGTNLAAAMEEAFRLHGAHPQQPLLIAIVSDAEIDVHSCEQSLVNATHRFPLPCGVFVTLLQIGIVAETRTSEVLNYLDNLRARSGAAYEPFIGIPFSRLRREGFGRDLLAGLQAQRTTAATAPGGTQAPTSPKVTGSSASLSPSTKGVASSTSQSHETQNPTEPKKTQKARELPIMWPAGGAH